ncbi:uncharacterized protein EDB91DRAFT_1241284 [Suillus paluster]|uniref:uncharacterized protein n=1 Tax=Suillus paluster TaxID=48578 RepID=UPI001B85DFCA|nr:uncharacterized protein EDB91DRAFT_1241284 [Suillus paluster]KAG1756188.1 hypothetical protein EDB91DRAFT_1241284 [Suillus paluster]
MFKMYDLHCWIRGTEPHEIFTLKISPLDTVDALKTMIKDSQGVEMCVSALQLYKPHNPVAEPYEANLSNVILSTLEPPLLSTHQISTLFEGPPPKDHIHIIVDAPELHIHCWLRGSTGEQRFDVFVKSNAEIGALKDGIKAVKSKIRDVDQSRISLYRISASEDNVRESLDTINASHLLEVTTAFPVYHYFLCIPVLEQLHIVVQVYSETNKEDNNLIGKLAHVMSALYENENKRIDVVSEVLNGYHLRLRLNHKVQGTAYETDGDMSIDVNNHRHPYVIVEFKE